MVAGAAPTTVDEFRRLQDGFTANFKEFDSAIIQCQKWTGPTMGVAGNVEAFVSAALRVRGLWRDAQRELLDSYHGVLIGSHQT